MLKSNAHRNGNFPEPKKAQCGDVCRNNAALWRTTRMPMQYISNKAMILSKKSGVISLKSTEDESMYSLFSQYPVTSNMESLPTSIAAAQMAIRVESVIIMMQCHGHLHFQRSRWQIQNPASCIFNLHNRSISIPQTTDKLSVHCDPTQLQLYRQ